MKKRILIIDDEATIRKSFTLTLEDAGFAVDTAESGIRGLEMIQKNRYDLILLDLKMPGIDGVQTLYEIRKLDRQVPVYLVTAFHKEFFNPLKAARKDGIDFQLLRKPLGREQLGSLAKTILD